MFQSVPDLRFPRTARNLMSQCSPGQENLHVGAYCMAYRLVSNDNRKYKLLSLETYLVLWLSADNMLVARIFVECGTVYHPIVILSM